MTGVAEARIATALFEGLTRLDPETLLPGPAAAERFAVSPDGLSVTFHLRPDGRWSDGSPVTAEDFRWSFLRVLDPRTASPYAGLLFGVRGARDRQRKRTDENSVGIEAPDALTLVVRLERPVPYFASLAAFATLLPVNRSAVERHGDRWTRPGHIVTNGPFVLEEWSFYRHLVLRRSPSYHGRDVAGAERIRLHPVPDPNTQFNLYETGAADIVFSVPSPILHRLRDRPDFRTGPRFATAFLRVNITRPSLASAAVRRALSLAIDRETLCSRILRGGERPAYSLVPPGVAGYDPPAGRTFEPAAAAELLASAGHPGGRGLPALGLLFPDNPEYAAAATVLQHDLRERLGVDIRLDPREWKVSLAAQRALDYDLCLAQWIGDYPDPTTFLDCFAAGSGNNRTGFASAAYDTLLERAATPEPGEPPEAWIRRRFGLLAEAEALLVGDEAPVIPLWHPTTRFLVAPAVQGFAANALGLVSFVDLRAGERR
ncbi:MAG: peptide ABC transporter substrate-binding protein [Planctomycetes bacterium]|jgi:oligopeptide transport system substrate-binding protein|nr:peptide ABC transporter substrate-binding protein [Planctomycetota bacterium]